MSEKKSRKKYSRELKRELVEEFVSGRSTAESIAEREGITAQFIYRWKTQVEEWGKKSRLKDLEADGMSPEDARRFRDLEEELEAYKGKVAELMLYNDLLKKLQPNYLSEKRSSGYAETKRKLDRSKGRAK